MKKISTFLLLISLNFNLIAKEVLVLDATDDKTLLDSFSAMSLKLAPDIRQDLSNASAIIMFYGSAMGYSEEKMRGLFDKKTTKELIDLAQSYCPKVRDENYKLKSETKSDFSRSFVVMLMNLPIEQQRKFSNVIAQIMMIVQLEKLDEELLLKELNGLTGKEIIANFESVNPSKK